MKNTMTKSASDERLASRWGVSGKTILNWRRAGVEAGADCPAGAQNPDEFLSWYRAVMGREPARKILERAARLSAESGEGVETSREVEFDKVPFEILEALLSKLGKSGSLARVLEEEERAFKIYERARDEGAALDRVRKSWADAQGMTRAIKKEDDCVGAAVEVVREVMRRELEPGERERRVALSGREMGAAAREELRATSSTVEWERVWDKFLERALKEAGR
jgi:hypothetical protein